MKDNYVIARKSAASRRITKQSKRLPRFVLGFARNDARLSILAVTRGFSLIETMLYISVLTVILGVFAGLVLSGLGSFAEVGAIRSLDIGAAGAMERILRTAMSATSVDAGGSVFGSSPGVLVLNSPGQSENVRTIFRAVGGNVRVEVDGIDEGVLLPEGVTAEELVFRQIDSGRSKAVKIELRLKAKRGKTEREERYYGTAILRGSYQ